MRAGSRSGADPRAVRARILELRAPDAALDGLRQALELEEDAGSDRILNAVLDLKQNSRRSRAEKMVNSAIEEGKILPAQREFYLNSAVRDPEATRMCLENMPPVVEPGINTREPEGPRGTLTGAERSICRQLGIEEEKYLRNR